MSQDECRAAVSIRELPFVVVDFLEHAHPRFFAGIQGPVGLFVRYLRRKPGRGLTILYQAGSVGGSRRNRLTIPRRWVTVMTGNRVLAETTVHSVPRRRQAAALDVRTPGTAVADAGVTVQVFPDDRGLLALGESCAPSPRGAVYSALETAARIYLRDDSWRLIVATAQPVRYKPSSRCVIRYSLLLERATLEGTQQKDVALYGKLYSDPEHAFACHATLQRLYAEQAQTGPPIIPRPLGAVDTLGLVLSAAVPASKEGEFVLAQPGFHVLRPRVLRGDSGEVEDTIIPSEALRMTAAALARLHTSALRSGSPRTGVEEAKRVEERAALIAASNPEQAERTQQLGHQLATLLKTLQSDAYRPAHGGFKPSQLLFSRHRVFMVDLDGFCLADPALDVGYFLAYLRPSGLWYDRAGMREWFEDSSARFVDAYRLALSERGIEDATTHAIMHRTRLYAAAILFKIAARRINRMNSRRPEELSSILMEVACLMKLFRDRTT